MKETTVQQLMDALPAAFLPENAGDTDAVIFFSLSGDKGGEWIATIRDQRISVVNGAPIEHPTLTLMADGQDVLDIFSGKLDPTRAFMMGKLRVKGNFGLAMKLTNLFRLDNELFQSMQ